MGRYFGTDGIRGVAGFDLTCELAMRTAMCAVKVLAKNSDGKVKIIIGKDTRESCDMLESAMASGFMQMGADVYYLGVVATPCVAYLVKKLNADAGVMISASHNPAKYNGIKFFDNNGFKLDDDIENEIECLMDEDELPRYDFGFGRAYTYDRALDDYIDFICENVTSTFENKKVVLDCSNGSASESAKRIFKRLGAKVISRFDKPDGININLNCGSTHIESLQSLVKEHNADIGFAFDGDADRCLAVDENGNILDGDKIICALAIDLKQKGKLKNNAVCVTVMSNMGLFKTMREYQIKVLTTKVGDRYVLEEMQKSKIILGGEQSGHVVLLDRNTTGDGQMTAVSIMNALCEANIKASWINSVMTVYPQVLLSIKANAEEKLFLENDSEFLESIENAKEFLKDDGRILVRASGTEPIVRIMAEGSDIDVIKNIAENLKNTAYKRLNEVYN